MPVVRPVVVQLRQNAVKHLAFRNLAYPQMMSNRCQSCYKSVNFFKEGDNWPDRKAVRNHGTQSNSSSGELGKNITQELVRECR